MALETLLMKVKTAINNGLDTVRTTAKNNKTQKKSKVGVLAFEIASLMSKLLELWQSLTDKEIARLRHETIAIEGVRKIVSNDESFLLSLACAEMIETLRLLAKSVSRLGKRCEDSTLQCFDRLFEEFANSGHDSQCWVLSWKEFEVKMKKIDRYVTTTASLHKQMDELSEMEHSMKKLLQCKDQEPTARIKNIADLQQKLFWQRQEVKYLKENSLWSRSFDVVTAILAKTVFTTLARIHLVFGVGGEYKETNNNNSTLLRSVSATVHPSENTTSFKSGPLTVKHEETRDLINGFFDSNTKILKPPASTLGAVGLALHYSNLVIVIEKMIRWPRSIGAEARDDLYAMLPKSIRVSLRERLRGVGFTASDPVLAGEWREAMGRILEWLAPLGHNMIKWQSDRSFEQQKAVPRTNVMLLQTLYFANQGKTEAAITELLVGLNYIWRFEREMSAKALMEWNAPVLMGC